MTENKIYTAMGLMSGTSVDAVDCAVIRTDGEKVFSHQGGLALQYSAVERDKIKKTFCKKPDEKDLITATKIVTQQHMVAIEQCIKKLKLQNIDVIGFHGQTIYHAPKLKISTQIGNSSQIAKKFKIPVVANFRQRDIENGGEGAPLAPIYHKAICKQDKTAFLNLGGVANITACFGNEMFALDCGTANSLMDDYMEQKMNLPFDENGQMARAGAVDKNILKVLLSDEYFKKNYPKSLDRQYFKQDFDSELWRGVGSNNLLATLAEFSAVAVARAFELIAKKPNLIVVSGGGMKNKYLLELLSKNINCKIITATDYGLDGDLLEAEAFAFLAVRRLKNLPSSFKTTTNVSCHSVAGDVFNP